MKISVVFDNFGPYHIARLNSLSKHCDLYPIELFSDSVEYDWITTEKRSFRNITLCSKSASLGEVIKVLRQTLENIKPDIVFVAGWANAPALATLLWAKENGCHAIVMSDTQEIDFNRNIFKEWVKSRILSCFSGAFVAGTPHRAYVEALGVQHTSIREGYDVVDNSYFESGAITARAKAQHFRQAHSVPQHYFLSAARFINKKNMPLLLDAFAQYRKQMEKEFAEITPWDLVIIGDGTQRATLEASIISVGLSRSVHLPGFCQYPDLPIYYGLASAFILASTTEQWGLVVNEAMASGLPVVVSDQCGCVVDLVEDGINGFSFNPNNVEALTSHMLHLTLIAPNELSKMGSESISKIAAFTPETFAQNALQLAQTISRNKPTRIGMIDKLILRLLINAFDRI